MKTNHGEKTLTLLGTKGGPALRTPGVSFLPTSNLLCLGQRKIIIDCGIGVTPVSYTHLTLPTIYSV